MSMHGFLNVYNQRMNVSPNRNYRHYSIIKDDNVNSIPNDPKSQPKYDCQIACILKFRIIIC